MALHYFSALHDITIPADAVVIADANLPESILQDFPDPILIQSGEALKSFERIEQLAQMVLQRRAMRPLILVAVGGGSVGDAVGFLASILWRGVELWHIPTTLLAMVDSAHGGKTAINLHGKKNQLGTFYPAHEVFIIEEILSSLPLLQRQEGLTELIKALWIEGDDEALELLEHDGGVEALAYAPFHAIQSRLSKLVQRSIDVKLRIVEQDPYDNQGVRIVLNLGHTVAHALELQYGISHGQAVAWGLVSCLCLSRENANLSQAHFDRLFRHIYPLLQYHPELMHRLDAKDFERALLHDKKHIHGALRSVILRAPGDTTISNELLAADWYNAFRSALKFWLHTPICAHLVAARRFSPKPQASKSILNRMLVIQYLRPGETDVHGESLADDVTRLQRCLQLLREAGTAPATLHCGAGGTTFRFLLAVAANRASLTRLYADASLLERPHSGIIEPLTRAGAKIRYFEDTNGAGYEVHGWESFPDTFEVPYTKSSQYASAAALLAAAGHTFSIILLGKESSPQHDTYKRPSQSYFEMTLSLLRKIGVHVESTGEVIHFSPNNQLHEHLDICAESDASSIAVWHVANFLNPEIRFDAPSLSDLQPDGNISKFLTTMRNATDEHSPNDSRITFDVSQCPDLVPVLVVAALTIESEVHFVGAAHLRWKESNRIDTLADALSEAGVHGIPTDDGLIVPSGIQHANACQWDTHNDHRMAMVALLLSASGSPITIMTPWVVSKSYPNLWHDARHAGWSIIPVL